LNPRRLSERRRQFSDDPFEQGLREVVAHTLDEHQTGARDRAGDGLPASRAHQSVCPAVDHDCRRGDPSVVVAKASAAQDRPEVPADALGIEATFVVLLGIGPQLQLDIPVMFSAMSYGSLGQNAIRAIARGAARVGIPMNTGEGGYPKYHLMEGADIIFQIGTAKFGVRNHDGDLDEAALRELANHEQIRMIEIKFSQGAKPGKGGLLPAEKITPEIAKLRGVPMGEDVVSPAYQKECHDVPSTVAFIARIQDLVEIPVGIKLCVGSFTEFHEFVREMKRQDRFPDFITIDGGEGGTGAAPTDFMDRIGLPLYPSLYGVVKILESEGVRDRIKILAAGKLINAGRQLTAFALGADACYTARGFMLALGCIQARECGSNTCPVGITTHDPQLQAGLDPELKATRVAHYVENTQHDLKEMLVATGKCCPSELSVSDLFIPSGSSLWQFVDKEPLLREALQTETESVTTPPLVES